MRRKLIARTKERSVEEILFDPQAWDYSSVLVFEELHLKIVSMPY